METDEVKKEEPEDSKEAEKPLSLVEEVKGMRDEFIKAKDELKEERAKLEKVQADNILSSSAGLRVEPKQISKEEKKINQAAEFFKGTALGDAITKSNE